MPFNYWEVGVFEKACPITKSVVSGVGHSDDTLLSASCGFRIRKSNAGDL